jgi:hypothetical protein
MDTSEKIAVLEGVVTDLTKEINDIDIKAETERLAALQATVDALQKKLASQAYQDLKSRATDLSGIEQTISDIKQDVAVMKSGDSGPPNSMITPVETIIGDDVIEKS